jgi:pilus assembly protein CpaC
MVMKKTSIRSALPAALLLCSALTAPLMATAARAEEAAPGTASAFASEIVVAAGKSQVVALPAPYTDVMVADPKVADVLPLSNRSIYVVGKTMGSTAITVYGPGKKLISAANVVVGADIESLKTRLHDVLPNEQDIAVRAANQSIVLSGTVSSPVALGQVLSLAESYAPQKVVNMLGVQGTQQVMLSVRFVEMQRSTAKDLQLNLRTVSTGGDPAFGINTGDTINGNTNVLSNLFGEATARLSRGADGLELLFDALEQKGLVKTLAEPTLVAMSGDTASFLAGGEFPIPVSQSNSGGTTPTITIEYKQFGVALGFTPTILKDGLVNLEVNPEVSAIDPTVSVSLGDIKVPGIKVRRAHTTVELRDGESFTIAGLLKEDYQSQIRQFPFVGDIPVLGALFRSNGYQRNESELVIVVTPHLVSPRRGPVAEPGQGFVPPSDLELFMLGKLQGQKDGASATDQALIAADPTKGGIDGKHGHVLY